MSPIHPSPGAPAEPAEPRPGEAGQPPRASASVLLLRDGSDGLEVLLLRRHPGAEVLGGVYVFPGGKLDAADCEAAWLAALDQPEADFAHRLNEPHTSGEQARGLHLAALRELYEEAGVLLAVPVAGAALHQSLQQGRPWPEALRLDGVQAQTAALRPWSRWITPRNPVVGTARFDTRFFLALLPPGQQAVPDQREAVEALWLAPRAALQRHWTHELELIAPQLMALAELARFESAAAAWQQALGRRAPCIEPAPFAEGALRGLCYPGDPCHAQPTRLLPGPTRLRVVGRRFEPVDGFEGWFA